MSRRRVRVTDGLTADDKAIYNRLPLARVLGLKKMMRHDYGMDWSIFLGRALAKDRGASPLTVQRNVALFESDDYPIKVTVGVGK